jgi:hypothetical protein
MRILKATTTRVTQGLGPKEKALLYFLIIALFGLNAYTISNSAIRFYNGSIFPDTKTKTTLITQLPPFTIYFCYPAKMGLWKRAYDSGPVLFKGYHHGQLHIGPTTLQDADVVGLDIGTRTTVEDLNCTYWYVEDYILNDPDGLYYGITGNSPLTNEPGFVSLVENNHQEDLEFSDLKLRDFVSLDGVNLARVQLQTYTKLNGTSHYNYNINVRTTSLFPEIPRQVNNSKYGTVYISFLFLMLDYYVSPNSETIVETLSFTYSDFLTTALTFFNLSFTVVFCCFPRQYLVASVQTFCLNPKPVYDPHRGTMCEMTSYRLPPYEELMVATTHSPTQDDNRTRTLSASGAGTISPVTEERQPFPLDNS